MYICYLDESGCTGSLSTPASDIQPVFVPAAVIVRQDQVVELTRSFLAAKARYFPALARSARRLDLVLKEIKGSDLRKQACSAGRNKRRHALGFFDRYFESLEHGNAKIVGRVLIKGIGAPIDGRAVYTSAVQKILSYFQRFLEENNGEGIVIADSRSKAKNANLSHSIFTQKFSIRGDRYPRILEMPTFGHSENHVGLQLADLLCSGLLFPIAAHAYCSGIVTNVHVQPAFAQLQARYGIRLKRLQFLYRDVEGRSRGGVAVDDRLTQRSGQSLFVQPSAGIGALALQVSETTSPSTPA